MAVGGAAKGVLGPGTRGVPPADIVFGHSSVMQPIKQLVGKILSADLPVLIQGENGTGKGLLAQFIHVNSPRRSGSFVKVNCAAIPAALLESELFGYEQGAFTHALHSKPGSVELADQGTLFLDEITELTQSLQAKVLQLLQDGIFSRIGDTQDRQINTRVVCATNRNLNSEVHSGRFRADLLYRINVITINLPPLRERREDIVTLVRYFLEQSNARFERNAPPLPAEVIRAFEQREWRGNIRELENLVARYAILGSPDELLAETGARRARVTPLKVARDGTVSLKAIAKHAVREVENNFILQVLRENKWNRRKAAQALNISYRALIYKIQEAGFCDKRVETRVDASPKNSFKLPE
jgi:two-component system response regulator AtoC